jgi:hypothetical protein
MINFSLGAAILLLWFAAPAQSTNSTRLAVIEGCLSGDVDAFVLTVANGKVYPLSGNTNQLTGRVGHKVRLWGQAVSGDPEQIPAGVPQATFEVEKVRSLSVSCKVPPRST